MRGARPLLISLALILMLGSSINVFSQSTPNCKDFTALLVETEITPDVRGNSYSLLLKFDDAPLKEYAVILNGPNKESKVFKNKEKKFDNLRAGQYDIYIIDRRGCSKQLNIKVK